MRNRPQRLLSKNAVSGCDNSDSNNSPLGIIDFNSPSDSLPSTPYMFLYPDLNHEENYVCPHCHSMLWKEEKRHGINCCNKRKYTIPFLKPVPPESMTAFRGNQFQRGQRAYSGLISFTQVVLTGKVGRSLKKRRQCSLYTEKKAYRRIFDLQQQYSLEA